MLQLRYKNIEKSPLWLVESKYSIGSSADCDLTFTTQGLKERQVELLVSGDSAKLINVASDDLVKVNGVVVQTETTLRAGDEVVLGSLELDLFDPKELKKDNLAKAPDYDDVTKVRAPEWSLQALNTALAEKQFRIVGTQVLGRSKECDISLGVAHLSRKHAKLSVTGKGLSVEDLESSNGTFVNGQKVEKAVLHAGDELSFDTLKFRVLGPQEDLESTTVRPVLKIPSEAPSAAKAGAKTKAQKPARRAGTKAAGASQGSEDKTSDQYKTSQMEPVSKKGTNPIIWVLLLAVISGVAWFVTQG